ncbi:MAG TPA: hypothetical protein VF599_02745 [Pyrinomonadaceae bacterium]
MFNKNNFFAAAVVVSILFAACFTANAQQTVFELEGNVRREVAVPAAVIAVLKSDQRVDACFREKGEGANEAAWFAASEIDLNGDRKMDLIIKAKDGCLFGANQGPFWIFQKMPDGYQQVLAAHGLQLAVLPKKINTFSQIKISKVVSQKPAGRIYSFKSGKYQ